MFDGFEELLTTQEGLEKLISGQLDDVYNKVNDRVKQHIDCRRKDLLTKKRQREDKERKTVKKINEIQLNNFQKNSREIISNNNPIFERKGEAGSDDSLVTESDIS